MYQLKPQEESLMSPAFNDRCLFLSGLCLESLCSLMNWKCRKMDRGSFIDEFLIFLSLTKKAEYRMEDILEVSLCV